MKKIKKSSELLWVLGVVLVALGVAICSKADLGVSMIAAPAFVMQEFISNNVGYISVGTVEYIIQGILLVIMCIAVKRFSFKYLLAFVVAVIYGYTLDLFLLILDGVSFDTVWLRWVMLIVGDTVTAAGVACFFRTYMPLQVYELFVSELSSVFKLDIGKTKWGFDITLLCLSVAGALLLFGDISSFDIRTVGYTSFHSIGLGTLVTTVINSPIIVFLGKGIDKSFDNSARFPKLEKVLKI